MQGWNIRIPFSPLSNQVTARCMPKNFVPWAGKTACWKNFGGTPPTEPLAGSPPSKNPEKCFSITHFALPAPHLLGIHLNRI